MKTLKNICDINISNSLHSLLEASILGSAEKTIADGNKYNNVDLKSLNDVKSEAEFNIIFDTLREDVLSSGAKTPRMTGINISEKIRLPLMNSSTIYIYISKADFTRCLYIGNTKSFCKVTYFNGSSKVSKSKGDLSKINAFNYDVFELPNFLSKSYEYIKRK